MDNQPTKRQKHFLVEWTILNLLGWVIGVYLVFLVATNSDTLKHAAWKYGLANDFRKEWIEETALVWLPLGISVGIFQWLKLRRFRVNLFVWVFVTVLGCSILVTLYAWVLNFDSFEYSEYNIPDWLINTGLVITLPIGGAINGGLQSIMLRKSVSRPKLWIRASIIGLLLPAIVAPLTFWVKSFLLNILYISSLPYFFIDARWLLFYAFLLFIAAVSTSILTGRVLSKYTNIDPVLNKAG